MRCNGLRGFSSRYRVVEQGHKQRSIDPLVSMFLRVILLIKNSFIAVSIWKLLQQNAIRMYVQTLVNYERINREILSEFLLFDKDFFLVLFLRANFFAIIIIMLVMHVRNLYWFVLNYEDIKSIIGINNIHNIFKNM